MSDALMRPSEVATLFKVHRRTVWHWETVGLITAIKTAGGHRRYLESEVRALVGDLLTDEELVTPREIATQLRVSMGTVARWGQTGKLTQIVLPRGGCYRYRASEVRALLGEAPQAGGTEAGQ